MIARVGTVARFAATACSYQCVLGAPLQEGSPQLVMHDDNSDSED